MIEGARYTLTGSGTSNLGWPEIALRERRVAHVEHYTNTHGNTCDGYVYEWVIETFDGLVVIAESELVEEIISGTYQYNGRKEWLLESALPRSPRRGKE